MTRQYQLRCIQILAFIAIQTHPNIGAIHSTTHAYLKFWGENQGEEVSTSAYVRNIRMLDHAEATIQWAGLLQFASALPQYMSCATNATNRSHAFGHSYK